MNKQIPYKTSRDYKRLKELLDKGYSIVCFVDCRWTQGHVSRELCVAKHMDGVIEYNFFKGNNVYYDQTSHKFTFEELCDKNNVEFIDIEEQTK